MTARMHTRCPVLASRSLLAAAPRRAPRAFKLVGACRPFKKANIKQLAVGRVHDSGVVADGDERGGKHPFAKMD